MGEQKLINPKEQLDMDLFEKIKNNMGPLGAYKDVAEGYYMFPKLEGEISNRMTFDGKEMIIWSINNYLGLANHPKVREVDTKGMEKWGAAYPMGARMMSGNTSLHDTLEGELASLAEKETSVLLNYGYQGIMSAIDALLTRHDIVIYDNECHACIMDAVRMHLGKSMAFKHNDIDDFEKQLLRAEALRLKNPNAAILVISEGVFGMKGDQGKLKEIVSLKEKYSFRLLVDDAHGFGVLGAKGAGAGVEQNVQDGIDIYFATFAKSMASIGAFLAGDKEVIDYLKYNMRSQIFAKSLPMGLVEGNLVRLQLLKEEDGLREQLWLVVNALQLGLKEAGFEIGNTNSCVTPVFLNGSVEEAMAMVYDLRENHLIFCSMVVYPVIPKGQIVLRLIPTAVHTIQDVEDTLVAFKSVAQKLKEGVYQKLVQKQ